MASCGLAADEKEILMAKVIVYSADYCSYCKHACALLDRKKITYTIIDVEKTPGAREEMEALTGRRTIPQIFIDGIHVGGYTDLVEWDKMGKLNKQF